MSRSPVSLFLGLSLCLCFCLPLQAQNKAVEKANYDLPARFSINQISKMVFSLEVKPNWFRHSDRFWYEYTTSQGKQWYMVDPAKAGKTPLFDLDKLAAQLTEIVKDPFDARHIPIKGLRLKDDHTFFFYIESSLKEEKKEKAKKEAKEDDSGFEAFKSSHKLFYFEYAIESRTLTYLKDYKRPLSHARWASFSPDLQTVVYAKGYDLYCMDRENYEKLRKNPKDSTVVENRLTCDGEKDFSYGYSKVDYFADSAFFKRRSRVMGLWSPDSRYFALVRVDQRKVKDLWVINSLSHPRPTLEAYKYDMPGEADISQEHLVVFDMKTQTHKTIKTAAFKDQTLNLCHRPLLQKNKGDSIRPLVWMGDEQGFYLHRASRDLKRIDLCRFRIGCDSISPLVEERMNTYMEVRNIVEVNGGKQFVHWSERTGWAQLYLYNRDGSLQNPITQGAYHVHEILGADASYVYFTACGKEKGMDPYYLQLYRARLDGSRTQRLSEGDFHYTLYTDDNCHYFVATGSRVDARPQSVLLDHNGTRIAPLETADLSLLFAMGYKFPTRFTVKAADGITDLYGVMYKPFDFDSTRLYPIIEYVYPGPQVEAVDQAWNKGFERKDRLAQFGFIVITVGNRGGHPNRSKWYHNYGYGNLRDYGLEDQKVAVERLAARYPFIDINRVGIHGHSGGGFMSTAALLNYPDFYKVAVSCSGNHENNIYNRWWSETHHGVQEKVSEKGDTVFQFQIDRNSQLAKNLKGRLLLLHGDIDDNVHPGNTLRLADALIKAHKRFDMFIFPGQRHGYGSMRDYFFWRMGDYFCRYLIGDSQEPVDIKALNNDR